MYTYFASFKIYLLVAFSCIRLVKSVVPEYCLRPLNRSDCGLKKTPVMTYWRPGSRCEVDFWRGCPTYNKFNNEYECSLHCIFKMSNAIEDPEPEVLVDDCEATLNQGHCMDIKKAVYTYENGACVQKTWRGCPSQNKFSDQNECEQACGDKDWESKLQDLDIDELKSIDEIIDTVTVPVTTTTEAPVETTEAITTTTEATTTEVVATEAATTEAATTEAATTQAVTTEAATTEAATTTQAPHVSSEEDLGSEEAALVATT